MPSYMCMYIDLNAPDLYIPLMAFITFVLLSGYVLGVSGEFTPEVCHIFPHFSPNFLM